MTVPTELVTLSRDEARHIAVAAQLLGAEHGEGSSAPMQVLEHLGAIQLDAMQRVDKSHRLVCMARNALISGREQVDEALWAASGHALVYEAWAHAVCLIPVTSWPVWQFRREATRSVSWAPEPRVCDRLVRMVRDEGPRTISDLEAGQAKSSGWDWSQTKKAAEYLVWTGSLVCCARSGTRRVYDLPERRIPAELLDRRLSKDAALSALVLTAARAYGVATISDIAAYFSLPKDVVGDIARNCGLIPASVEGWADPGWLHPEAAADSRQASDVVLLSPFDNLIWDRDRFRRLFDFDYVLEAYKPPAKRVYGHYVMPLLVGTRMWGRADVARDKRILRILRFFPEPGVSGGPEALRTAATRLAQQMRCEAVQIESHSVEGVS